MRVDACPEPSQNQGNELMHWMGGGDLGRWFPEGFGENPSRTEAKA